MTPPQSRLKRLVSKAQDAYYLNARQAKNSYFNLEPPPKHYIYLFIGLLSIFGFSIYKKYETYRALRSGLSFEAKILNHYPKVNKNPKSKAVSEIVRFRDRHFNTYYGIYRGRFKDLKGLKARIYGKIYNCSFIRFLRGCRLYHSSFDLIPDSSPRPFFKQLINSQHESPGAASLFNALFLANPLDKQVRNTITALGISHLVALSGLHLASLSFFLLLVIAPIYHCIHKRLCYRNAAYDLGLLVLGFNFLYLNLIDFQPSFLRAFIMSALAFALLYSGLRILNITNLLLCALLALAIYPSLAFDIGFILSVAGVFYIFLFMRYSLSETSLDSIKASLKWVIKNLVLFNVVLFLQLSPLAHTFLPYFSAFQLASIPLSALFPLIFPALIGLHLLGLGGLFDSAIDWALALNLPLVEVSTPIWLLLSHLALSLLALRYKLAYLASLVLAAVFFAYEVFIYIT